jgi:rod shape-determining protein MreD
VAGFLVGLASDVLTPAAFGAGALAHTVVAYIAAWGRAVFFPDNLLVNAGLFAGGVWLRNAIVLLASGTPSGQLTSGLLVWAPLQALSTAAAGLILLLLFRDWFAIRIEA